MEIISTQNYNFTRQNKSTIRNKGILSTNPAYNARVPLSTNSAHNTRVSNDTFSSKINFGKRVQKTAEELEHLAYCFYDIDLLNLKHIGVIMEITKVTGTIFKDYEASRESFKTVISKIKELKALKKNVLERLSEIEIAKGMELDNTVEQQLRVKNQFSKFVEAERKGNDVSKSIPNGIFVHGESKEKNNSFVQWILANTPVLFDNEKHIIKYNSKNPLKTLEEIKAKALEAKDLFKPTRERTLLYIENLDELFTDYSTPEKRQIIARYKGFIEHVSEDCHTTLLMKSEKPVEDFEPASLGGQRFGGLNIPIKAGITQDEIVEEKELKEFLDNLYILKNRGEDEILPRYGLYGELIEDDAYIHKLGITAEEYAIKDLGKEWLIENLGPNWQAHPKIRKISNELQEALDKRIGTFNKEFGSDEWQKIVRE